MISKNNFIIGFLVLYGFVISLALIFGSKNIRPKYIRNSPVSVARLELNELGSQSSGPINYDNLLFYAIKINEISISLNKAIRKSNLDLPSIKFYNSELSYKSPGRSWMVVSDNTIIIFLYKDVSSVLNADEVMAVAVHELGHFILDHRTSDLVYKRNTAHEIAADKFAVDSGISPVLIISALNKLSPDNYEKSERILALLAISSD